MIDTNVQITQSRPRNAAATRAAILDAARARFLLEPYDQVGVRQIAGDAGIDAALICRYFGGKEDLFAEVVGTTGKDPMEIIAGDRNTFGIRVARALLDPEEQSLREAAEFINLAVRSTMSPVAGSLVRKYIEARFIRPFATWLGGPKAIDKAWLTASILMGATVMRGIHCGPNAPAENKEGAIAELASVLQQIVDDE